MLSLWNLYLLLPLSSLLSLHAGVSTGENVKETQQTDTDTAVQDLIKPSQRKSGLTPVNPLFRPQNADFLALPLSWPSLSSEESDRQGVIGEYTDLQESTEAALVYPYEKGPFESRPTESATSGESIQPTRYSLAAVPPQPTKEQTFKYEPFDTSTGSMQTGNSQNETNDSRLPFLSSGSLPSEQDSTQLSAGPGISPENTTQLIDTSSWEWMGPSVTTEGKTQGGTVPVKKAGDGFVNVTDHILHREGVGMETGKDDSRDNGLQGSRSRSTSMLDGNMDTSTTPCKTANQSWTPTYLDDFTPSESLPPSLALSPGLYVPLYPDWNSALATWGFAWEAHIYGLGSVFSVFSVISVMCLLGLLLRCPPGSPYFTLLHLFLLAFAGMQAFCLLYDAYSHQDRLPPLGSLMLSELPFPCLIAAFSMAFLLLLLCSHMHISLPLSISSSFSNLTKPRLFLCISLLHFGVSLGCVGLLQLFHNLPTMILLSPHCLFVCLTIFLSCSYLMFYCLIRVNTKHIYRLNDNVEAGGSPEVVRPANCPFAKVEDWHRAAGAGVGASLCLLGCGGLQLYGILYALGLGRVDDYGFQPWSWWSYQVGCRLCEIGVCLGLSLIGTHPLFCQNNTSIKTITQPRPGSWSRLSCGSPSQGLNLPSPGGTNPPVLPSPNSWSQDKQGKLVVCDVVSKGQSDTLLLCSMVDPPENGLDCVPKSMQIQTTIVPLPTPQSPPQRLKNAGEPQLSSLDSLAVESDSTVDLRPPSPIDLSRSIDQALFSESLFSHSIFGLPRLFHTSSSHSLSSPSQGASKQDPSSVENSLYRTSSCGVMDKEKEKSSRSSQPHGSLTSNSKTLEQWDWKESVSGSTQGLCSISRETGKLRSHSWANRGQSFAQHSLPRAIPHLSYHRRYRTLSLASQDIQGTGQLAGTKHLSESKQLEWDLAVQAEFVNVCKQIDALSVCSDTIEL